jgi:hypothetical protein
MTELTVPFVRSGTGSSPLDGGCILQVVDWIATEGWTDQPECVHPVLRSLAIHANDTMGDADRQKLLDLTPRLMGTNTGDVVLTTRLLCFLARKVLHIYEEWAPDDDRVRRCIEAAEEYADARERGGAWAARAAEAAEAARAAGAAWAAWAARAAIASDYLVETLDEYDRLTGRTQAEPIPAEAFAAVCDVMR